jgi:hypothetical protein
LILVEPRPVAGAVLAASAVATFTYLPERTLELSRVLIL